MKKIYIVAALVVSLFVTAPSYSQSVEITNIHLPTYAYVYSIYANAGICWVATGEGAYAYDGQIFPYNTTA